MAHETGHRPRSGPSGQEKAYGEGSKENFMKGDFGAGETYVYCSCLILFRKDSLFVEAFRTHAAQAAQPSITSCVTSICLAWSSSSKESRIIIKVDQTNILSREIG